MTIEIKITDPHKISKEALRKTATYLLHMIGDDIQLAPESPTVAPVPQPLATIPIPPLPVAPVAPVVAIEAPVYNPFIAPASPAMVAPVTVPAVATVASAEVDAYGLPWDIRIHSRSKSKIISGAWKLKREVPDSVVRQVETELRQALSASGPAPATVPPVSSLQVEDPVGPIANDFPRLMELLTGYIAAGKFTVAQRDAIVKDFGIPSFALLATRPDLIPAVIAAVQSRVTL